MTDSLRGQAFARLTEVMDHWPAMQLLKHTPYVPSVERATGGASSPQNDHSDPTASTAISGLDLKRPADAWLRRAASCLQQLAALAAEGDTLAGPPIVVCEVCERVIDGDAAVVKGCHRFCYQRRYKQDRRNQERRQPPSA